MVQTNIVVAPLVCMTSAWSWKCSEAIFLPGAQQWSCGTNIPRPLAAVQAVKRAADKLRTWRSEQLIFRVGSQWLWLLWKWKQRKMTSEEADVWAYGRCLGARAGTTWGGCTLWSCLFFWSGSGIAFLSVFRWKHRKTNRVTVKSNASRHSCN